MEGGLVKMGSDKDERIGSKRGRDEDEDEEKGNMGRLEKRPSGMVMMIDQEYEYSGDEMINGVKYEEEKPPTPPSGGSGGLFNQFITNLVNNSPRSINHQQGTDFFEGELEKNSGSGGGNDGEVGGEGGDGGGGLINNFISNIFSSNSNGGGEVVEKDGDGGEVVENNGCGAGGEVVDDGGKDIIDSIVAKLPRTLSEDTAPATDEASILIHSIIHD